MAARLIPNWTPPPIIDPVAPSFDKTVVVDKGFSNVLEEAISRVESFRTDATQSVTKFMNGEGEELHQMAMATQRAELALDMFLQVRNKVVSAYQEIMRMQM